MGRDWKHSNVDNEPGNFREKYIGIYRVISFYLLCCWTYCIRERICFFFRRGLRNVRKTLTDLGQKKKSEMKTMLVNNGKKRKYRG